MAKATIYVVIDEYDFEDSHTESILGIYDSFDKAYKHASTHVKKQIKEYIQDHNESSLGTIPDGAFVADKDEVIPKEDILSDDGYVYIDEGVVEFDCVKIKTYKVNIEKENE